MGTCVDLRRDAQLPATQERADAPPPTRGGGAGCSARQERLQGAPGASVQLPEVTIDRLEVVPLDSIASYGTFVVLIGVHGLQDAVCGARPGRDSRVALVQLPQRLALAVGECQRPSFERSAGSRVDAGDVPIEEHRPLWRGLGQSRAVEDPSCPDTRCTWRGPRSSRGSGRAAMWCR